MYLSMQKLFTGSSALMMWYEWMLMILALTGLMWTIWPWLTRVNASENPDDATTFRAWRVNFLIGTIVVLLNLTIVGYYVTLFIFGWMAIGTAA